MTTPLVMNLVNAPILPVYIRAKALNKILNGKHAYQLDADLLKQIPRALTDPAAIYSSDTQPGPDKMVAALDIKDKNDAHIVATFALSQSSNEVDGTHAYQLNFLTSVYGKDNNDKENPTPRDNWFLEQLEKGNLKYINRKEAPRLLRYRRAPTGSILRKNLRASICPYHKGRKRSCQAEKSAPEFLSNGWRTNKNLHDKPGCRRLNLWKGKRLLLRKSGRKPDG